MTLLYNAIYIVVQVNTLKLVGGTDFSNRIVNVLKKLMTDRLAENFSHLGHRTKENFSVLSMYSIVKSECLE